MWGPITEAMHTDRRQIIRIAAPVLISLFAQNIVGITDTAFVSRLGEVALGGVTMASMAYFCIFTLGFGLGMGTQIIVARHYGARSLQSIGSVLWHSLLMLLFSAVLAIVLGLLWGGPFFSSVLSSSQVAEAATVYWDWRIWGLLFSFVGIVSRSFFVGIARTKVLTYNAFVMAVVNIVLDYGLIFGKMGMPRMGIEGAAVASVLSEVVSLAFYLLYALRRIDFSTYGICRSLCGVLDWRLMKRTLGLSVYIMLQSLLSLSSWTLFFFMIEHLGERPLAVASIIRSIYIFLYISISAYSTAVNTMVSAKIGAGESASVAAYLREVVKLSFLTMLVLCLITMAIPSVVLRIFTDDPSLIEAAKPALYVICVALCVCATGNMYFSAVSATGATKIALYIEAATVVLYVLYSAMMTYVFKAPVHICYTVEVVYYILIALLSYAYIRSGKWREKKWVELG